MAAPYADCWADALATADRLRAFQASLNDLPSSAARKAAVMEAHCVGLLDEEQTQLLFDVYDLATA